MNLVNPDKRGNVWTNTYNYSNVSIATATDPLFHETTCATPVTMITEKDTFIAATEDGDLETVRRLIRSDQEILNVRTDLGMTALHRAARFGRVEIVKTLLSAGMKPSVRDNRGHTPLHDSVCDVKSLFCTHLLIEAGCPIESKSHMGYTPLMVAAQYCNLGAVAFLLAVGANSHSVNRRGMTALANNQYLYWESTTDIGSYSDQQLSELNNIKYFLENAMSHRNC